MIIFHWRSKAMAQYAWGNVMAVADDVETARAMIMAEAKTAYLSSHFSYYFDENDEDDIRQLEEFKTKLKDDIDKEPDISETLFILGSE